jgi:hypothetical protein
MEFSPAADTAMSAVPVGSGTVRTSSVTPSAARLARSRVPGSSSPNAPTNVVSAPARAAAVAWLLPLPPAWVANPVASTVSPGAGIRSTWLTRSRLPLPTTTTVM